jgi:hypothetical protein
MLPPLTFADSEFSGLILDFYKAIQALSLRIEGVEYG